MTQKLTASRDTRTKRPRKRKRLAKRITGLQLFVKEKMPADFSALSEEEWSRILTRKYRKLSPEDKVGTSWASGG